MKPPEWHAPAFARVLSDRSRLPHALLLRGPHGIGKLLFARALAQALLCERPLPSGGACEACAGCAWFEAGTHPDYRQVEPASMAEPEDGGRKSITISVDQIRALSELINLSSHRAGKKIVVIHPAETMNVAAANALLKNLEEPPPQTHFLLVTHRPHQLLPTLKSRCCHVALGVPDRAVAAQWLAEQGVRDPDVALAHTGGAPLLASELAANGYWGARAAFMRHMIAPDMNVLWAAEASRDFPVPHVLAWLQKWSYDLAHYQLLGKARFNPDHSEPLARLAARLDPLAATRFHREMVKLQLIAHHPVNARLFIEDLLFQYRDLVASDTPSPA